MSKEQGLAAAKLRGMKSTNRYYRDQYDKGEQSEIDCTEDHSDGQENGYRKISTGNN